MKVRTLFWIGMSVLTIVGMDQISSESAGGAAVARVPKTGQVTCYDESGSAMSCANTGQDGDLQKGADWPNPRFTKNADTTITDNLTGLVWAPNGDLLPARDPQWEKRGTLFEGAVSWQHALDYVAKLNAEKYLGYNDWRMPNFSELASLVNRAQPDSAKWLNSQGFINVQALDYYWSSTSNVNEASRAWAVDMGYGTVHSFAKANSHRIWPVRAGQ